MKYRIKRNRGSIQVFEGHDYIGSYPIKKLCQLIKGEKGIGTKDNMAQETTRPYLKKDDPLYPYQKFGTKEEFDQN